MNSTISALPLQMTLADRVRMFLRDRGYNSKTIEASRHNASLLTPEDAASVQRIVNTDHFRPDPPTSNGPTEVECLTWAGDILADPHAPIRLRRIAVALQNEDNMLGVKFLAPVMTETEADEYQARTTVAQRIADAAPRLDAIGQSLAETQRRLDELDRRAAANDPIDALEAEVCDLLSRRSYTIDEVAAALAHVRQHGTGYYSETIGPDEADEVTDLIVEHTAGVNYESAADWPECYDEWTIEDEDVRFSIPDEHLIVKAARAAGLDAWEAVRRLASPPVPAFAPLPAAELLTAGLSHLALPAICGGSPSPDARPVRLRAESNAAARARHRKGQPLLTDEDVIVATGCCG